MKKIKNYLYIMPAIPAIFAIVALIQSNVFKKNSLFFIEGVAVSCALICIFVFLMYPKNNKALWFLTGAFILSVFGDLFMKNRAVEINFVLGILFFLLAHLGFLFFALVKVKFSLKVFLVTVTPFLIMYFTVFMPSDGLRKNWVLAIAVFVYLLISCVSFSATIERKNPCAARWVFTAGIASLLISDTLIAFNDFLGVYQINFLIMPLYYLCHVLVALSVTLEHYFTTTETL